MQDRDKIIVYKKYHSAIEANLAKTKLDAYDVPCFLSEEHMTTLTTSLLSGGVRLHLFASDKQVADEILNDTPINLSSPYT